MNAEQTVTEQPNTEFANAELSNEELAKAGKVSTRIRLCALDEIGNGEAKRFDNAGHRLAAVRIDETVYIIGDECSHADYSLAEGEVDVDDLTLECWKHGSTFSLATGEPTCFPATKAVPTYDTEIVDGEVFVTITPDGEAA